ncbi:heterogeneous nuclear ribonucleoprotein Q-like [Primulina huaijiensis]|uniref:heterogeneous nuclear ribonucleoprotein Q-like n=1 Tax=Primulina huaijiensis TaxID=1492673 RepID=UPI003CC76A6D
MTQPSEIDHKHAIKGTEVFVGGLPRTISEDKIRQEFSVCGEIVEIRLIKDQNGNLKGFCFVRFSTKEAAGRAVREKSGTLLEGKSIGVLPSIEHNALYFGNLNKAWSADEFEKLVLQVFPDVVSVDLPIVKDIQPGQKPRNRGFAFVRFSSHAAAARAQRVGSQPDFRLGNLHPAVQWAEEDPEIDPKELAKVMTYSGYPNN